MPTTSSHSLPYPDDTDPADVPADIGALAEAVDTKLDAIAPGQITGPTSGQILIANSSGVVTGTSVTGDVTISNAGVTEIGAGAVGTTEIANSAVTTVKLDGGAVTAEKVATNAVTSTGLRDDASTDSNRAVTTNHLRNSAVTTEKVNDGAVTEAKIAANAITSSKILDGTIATADLANSAVTTAKIDAAAVTTAKIDAGAVTTEKVATNAVTPEKVATPSAVLPTNNVSGIQSTVSARRFGGGLVVLQGFYAHTTLSFSAGSLLSTLPEGVRPVSNRVFPAWSRNASNVFATTAIEIQPDGEIRIHANGVTAQQVWLDGIAFLGA